MGEQEHRCFDNEVERSGPLAVRFNFRCGLWSSKLDLSRPNTADTFVNTVDVMERTEDGIEVNRFSLDKCIPFCAWKACWGT
jgi:hypothetical protein